MKPLEHNRKVYKDLVPKFNMTEEPNVIIKEQESLTLEKNSRGYNWKIKLLEIDIDRLDEINEKMKEKYALDG